MLRAIARLRYTFPNTNTERKVQGIVTLTSGAMLALITQSNSPGPAYIARSADSGVTWNIIHQWGGTFSSYRYPILHLTGNIAVVALQIASNGDLYFQRSLDGGYTWDTTGYYPNPQDPLYQVNGINHGATYGRKRALICGSHQSGQGAPFYVLFRSSAGAASWTTSTIPPTNEFRSRPQEPYMLGRGTAYVTLQQPYFYPPTAPDKVLVLKSTTYGGSWENTGTLPGTGGDRLTTIDAIAALTPQIILAGGGQETEPYSTYLPLWRSTNAGSSWDRVQTGDIPTWVTVGQTRYLRNIRRIAKHTALLQWHRIQNEGDVPWAISTNDGQTFDLIPELDADAIPATYGSHSRGCRAPNGQIIVDTAPPYTVPGPCQIWSLELLYT